MTNPDETTKANIQAYPDFLPADHFAALTHLFMREVIPWHFNDRVVTTERHFMFTHAFMDDGKVLNQHFFPPVNAMLPLIRQKRRFIGVSRIKANLYTNQGRKIAHPAHHDIPLDSGVADRFFVAAYHVNTCNGATVVDGQEFPSIANQLILFDNVSHYGTVQTDTDTRIVINFTLRF